VQAPHLRLDRRALQIVQRRIVQIHRALVRQVIKQVMCAHGRGAALLAPEDEVDPVVQVGGHVLRLERRTILFG
jgi:hypothetical protein